MVRGVHTDHDTDHRWARRIWRHSPRGCSSPCGSTSTAGQPPEIRPQCARRLRRRWCGCVQSWTGRSCGGEAGSSAPRHRTICGRTRTKRCPTSRRGKDAPRSLKRAGGQWRRWRRPWRGCTMRMSGVHESKQEGRYCPGLWHWAMVIVREATAIGRMSTRGLWLLRRIPTRMSYGSVY